MVDAAVLANVEVCLRAARAVWVTAGVVIVLFGGCSLVLGILGMTPAERWPQVDMGVPAEQMRMATWVAAVVMAATFWLPGLALMFLGFGVKSGQKVPTLAAAVILVAQALLLGLFILLSLAGTLMGGGSVLELLLSVVFYGGVLALILWAVVRVMHARRVGGEVVRPAEEPWNSHLAGGGW